MNKEKLMSGSVGLIVGVILTLIIALAWGNGRMGYGLMMGKDGYKNSENVTDKFMTDAIDGHFIEQMIPHHEDAITMANLALIRAEHQEIKTLANAIIKAQSEEIDQMENWYKSWFGEEVPSFKLSAGYGMGMMMHGGMMGNKTDVTYLENAKPFDKEFIEQMIPHHQMAVMMGQMLLYSTNRSEMKQLAENIISAQTKEINEMREWYQKWYSQ